MGKAVAAFNCVTGNKMTEPEGSLLLQLLKDVRQWSTPNAAHVDSLQDCIAYAALKAECIIEQNHIPDSMKMVYSDTGYTEQDMQAASLVHDALDPALVELCSNTTIHADWIEHVGKGCPLDDPDTMIYIKVASGADYDAMPAEYANFLLPIGHEERITHWRLANKEQK